MWNLIIGAIIAIGTAILIENLRRPHLTLSIESPPAPPVDAHYVPARNGVTDMRGVRVILTNKPLPQWAGWIVRAPALQCRAEMTFHHLDTGHNVFARAMSGRWADSPEPVPTPIIDRNGNHVYTLIDHAKLITESRIDVLPGDSRKLDIANKCDNDPECYGWNNETYFSTPPWRNPAWRLNHGQYLVRVTVTSSGQSCVNCFRLVNDVMRTDFRLEDATDEERRRLPD